MNREVLTRRERRAEQARARGDAALVLLLWACSVALISEVALVLGLVVGAV